MSKADRIAHLIFQYSINKLNETEWQELNEWINESEKNRIQFERLTDPVGMKHFLDFREKMQLVMAEKKPVRKILFPRHYWQKIAAVAAIFLMAIAGIYVWYGNKNKPDLASQTQQKRPVNDVPPGSFKALLRLEGGKQIVLDSAGSGLLAQQGDVSIYNEGGQVKYNGKTSGNNEIVYNVLETGIGQTYTVVLSDGTKVWLNSKSSLKFPVTFSDNERNVEVEGEAYFEVTKNAKKPFVVKFSSAAGEHSQVEVLGTQFNINAYNDEPATNTTLIEGSIKISQLTTKNSKFISPRQQARLDGTGVIQVINNVNIDAVTAWKNQSFYFESLALKAIMRQLSRWYGIEVIYQGNIPERRFGGMVSRNRNLSEVLKMLQLSDIHFKIENKKLTVIP